MSTDGILEYQGTKRVLFRGDTSNIVFDTRTTSLGIGVTGSNNPSSNLYITGNAYVSSNLAIGGVMTMGVVNVAARHSLQAVTAIGNVTTQTVQFDNPTTAFTTTGNVSDLNIVSNVNMLHTANTAAIKLNSNVVTEFPRSKKLIKYPRVAMTQNDESATSGYIASAHSEWPDGTNYHAFRVFNNWGPAKVYVAGAGWESANTLTFGDDGLWGGSGASGASTSSSANTTMTLEEGNTIYGEWLQIQLPTKIRLEYVNFSPLSLYGGTHDFMGAYRSPRAGYILGSNNGINWTTLKNWSGIDYDTWVAYEHTFYKFDIDKEVDNYQYFRFVWTETSSGSGSTYSRYASCQELEFWGVPEYDPEADGTDVVVKSVPNVPNTDFLDVFVDAGNTSGYSLSGSSVTSVTDLSSPANTMSVTGVTYDSTNKAFVFSGSSSSYIKATLLNGNGNYAHTLSAWFMMTDYSSSWRNIIGLGTSFTNNQSAIAYDPYQDQLYYGTYGADIYIPHKPELYKWYHVAATFSGGSTTSTTMNIYLNGVNMGGVPNGTQTPSFTGDQLCIGGTMNSNGVDASNPFKGQIANARFYRRAYTPDEIYQLYVYQKEDFGHGDLSMTLKAGRLGIGTSEPRAALDVKGAISFTEESFDLRNVNSAQWPASAGYPSYSGDNITTQFMWRTLGSSGGTDFNYHVPRNGILMVNVTMLHRLVEFRASQTTHSVYWCLRKSTDNGVTWNALTSHLIGHRWINSSGWDQEWHPVTIPFTGRVNEGDQVALFVQNEYTQSGSTFTGNFEVYDCRMRGILI